MSTPPQARSLQDYGSDNEALGYGTADTGIALVWRIVPYLGPYVVRFTVMVVLTILSSTLKIGVLVFLEPGAKIVMGSFDAADYAALPFLGTGTGQEFLGYVGALFADRPTAALELLIGLVLGTIAVQVLTELGSTYLQNAIGGRVAMDVQRDLVDRVLAQPISFVTERGKGELASVMQRDTAALYRTFYVFFDRIARGAVEAVLALSLALAIDWRLTLFALGVVGPLAAVVPQFSRRMRKRERESFHYNAVKNLIVQEMLAAPLAVKAYLMERYFADRLDWARKRQFRRHMSLVKVRAWMGPTMELFFAVVIAGFLYYNGRALMAGSLALPQMLVLYACLARLIEPIRRGAKGYTEFVINTQSVRRVLDVLDRAPALADAPDAVELTNVQGHLEFREVDFAYRADRPALMNVSFTVRAGERVALVGPSGAGKSTIAALLMRLYDPDRGVIAVDGQDIAHVRQESLRRHMGLVTQDTVIFSDTVRMNITCGAKASDAAVEAAARAARAHDFIMALPAGYQTNLGDLGTNLSGGQRQRLAMARCLLRNTPILVFDEATSSLDAVTEAEIQEEIEVLAQGRTTVIIAHRFSTILNAERIIFIEGGRIQSTGTHEELYATNALYRDLLQRQVLTVDDLRESSVGPTT